MRVHVTLRRTVKRKVHCAFSEAVLGGWIEPGQRERHRQRDRHQHEPQADVAELAPPERGHRRAQQQAYAVSTTTERAHRNRPDALRLPQVRRNEIRGVGLVVEDVGHG
jgi:hypothetical protein